MARAALALFWLGLAASHALAATLIVKIEAVSPRGGNLRVALYDNTSYEGHDADPVADRVVNAVAPETIVEFDGVAPGTYAIKMFQDVNRNGKFDLNVIGLRGEPFGFSNDARPLFDQPPFDAAKFTIGSGKRTIMIRLRHWFSQTTVPQAASGLGTELAFATVTRAK